jgi:hypothetical protein
VIRAFPITRQRPSLPADVGLIALAIALVALAITAPAADAASTRAEYVAQVDPICHTTDLKAKRLSRRHHLPRVIDLSVLRSGEREDQLVVARQLALSHKVIGPFIAAVSPIPPPPGDEAIIAKWVGDYRYFMRNSIRAVRAIRQAKPRRAYHLIVTTLPGIVEDAEALEPWGFQYCTR